MWMTKRGRRPIKFVDPPNNEILMCAVKRRNSHRVVVFSSLSTGLQCKAVTTPINYMRSHVFHNVVLFLCGPSKTGPEAKVGMYQEYQQSETDEDANKAEALHGDHSRL